MSRSPATTCCKGSHELTLGELGRQAALEQSSPPGGDPSARRLATEYHARWALACATLVFALFSLSPRSLDVTRDEPSSVWPRALCISLTTSPYSTALSPRVWAGLPPFAIAWLPNVVLALTSAALITARLKAEADTTDERAG